MKTSFWKPSLVFGVVGMFFFLQFAEPAAWKSFAAGWLISVINLELLSRIGRGLIAYYNGQKPGKGIYFLVLAKFSFLGLIIAILSSLKFIRLIPFIAGTLTLIVTGVVFAFQEFFRDKPTSLRVSD